MRLNKRKFWSKLKQAVERMNADEEDCFRWSFERVGTNCAIAEKTELTWDHYQLRFSDEMGSARIEAYVVVLHEHQDTEVFMSEHGNEAAMESLGSMAWDALESAKE